MAKALNGKEMQRNSTVRHNSAAAGKGVEKAGERRYEAEQRRGKAEKC
jgi:hypothetical protein